MFGNQTSILNSPNLGRIMKITHGQKRTCFALGNVRFAWRNYHDNSCIAAFISTCFGHAAAIKDARLTDGDEYTNLR
jgi:hypothetical protein